ncbi:MAG TPA: hypothetical protein PKD80_15830 [Microthrixaceae bacterium]|jgi:hypothetical protein|nr:hypothetical protein [Microthrixaceae bacterium]HMT25603.1 hypothetical protein [Microthrixaceae bacterium]HMT62070.1 hypothetical protein [Microthrixaceae bacterium]
MNSTVSDRSSDTHTARRLRRGATVALIALAIATTACTAAPRPLLDCQDEANRVLTLCGGTLR